LDDGSLDDGSLAQGAVVQGAVVQGAEVHGAGVQGVLMVTLSSLKQAVRLQTQTDRSMRQAAFPLRRASGSYSGSRGPVGQLIRAAAVTDSVQVEKYVRLRRVMDAVLGALAVVAVQAVIGVTEAAARIVRLPVIRARRSVTSGNVPLMSAADTPVRPLAASTCSGLARNSA
jgi:hypothetical protein